MKPTTSINPRAREVFSPCHLAVAATILLAVLTAAAQGPDPLASNNTVYPTAQEWSGGFRTSNYDYPTNPVPSTWVPGANGGRITHDTAYQYMLRVKEFVTADMSGIVNDPLHWSPAKVGWYDMMWSAQGSPLPDGSIDPNSGREAILGSYTGQILQPYTFKNPVPAKAFQNHAVIYYNDVAAAMLGRIWKDPYQPDLSNPQFPEGSIVVKVESATLTPDEWPPLANSAKSWVYRPTVEMLEDPENHPIRPTVVETYFSQMAVKIKDSVASPETGWVFMAFAYDATANGTTVWDRAVPVGAMWGNDPQFADNPSGTDPNGGPLLETWLNPSAPAYTHQTLGWGGRLAGPMDVATRHNVITVSGTRYPVTTDFAASSCLSCHSAAQLPFTENLYPSPNKVFPEDGQPFLFFDPGSKEWARWFQNRPGTQALSGDGRTGIEALDYDMLLTFSLGAYSAAAGNLLEIQPLIHVH
jgi:hypothetical protein